MKLLSIAVLSLGLGVGASSAQTEFLPPERTIDWSQSGIPGGIPEGLEVFCNVKENIPGSDLVAVGDGVTDDTPAIREALDLCPPGQVVFLPEGNYRIQKQSDSDRRLIIRSAVLRGAGPDKTKILTDDLRLSFYPNPGHWRNLPIVGGDIGAEEGTAASGTDTGVSGDDSASGDGSVSGDDSDGGFGTFIGGFGFDSQLQSLTSNIIAARGGTWVDVKGEPPFLDLRELISINQLNDGELVDPSGVEGNSRWRGVKDRNLSQTAEVRSIEDLRNGNFRIHFAPELHWNYSRDLSPEVYYPSFANYEAGIEDLTIESPSRSLNTAIEISGARHCWVENVKIRWAFKTGIYLRQSLQCEIRDSWIESTEHLASSGGYGIQLDTDPTHCLIENNVIVGMRVPLIVSGGSGNVFGYNYTGYSVNHTAAIAQQNISFHACFPKYNLVEGNVLQRVGADNTHGSNGFNVLLRNWCMGRNFDPNAGQWSTSYNFAASLDQKVRYMSFVGNIMGWEGMSGHFLASTIGRILQQPYIWTLGFRTDGDSSGSGNDPLVEETLINHGNFDYVSNSTVWDSTNFSDQTIPKSLYLESKPEFFESMQWPPFGPDVPGRLNPIPAQRRFVEQSRPVAPSGLEVLTSE